MQEGKLKIKVYRNFGEKKHGAPKGVGAFGIEGIHSSLLLGARGGFWDWETSDTVRSIDVETTNVSFVSFPRHLVLTIPWTYWSGTGTLVAIVSEDPFYILRFDREVYNAAPTSGIEIGDEGVESAFEGIADVSERCAPA